MEIRHALPHSKVPCLIIVLILLLTVATFEFLHLTDSVPGVSAVESTGTVGIYWDAGCTKTVSSIDWGNLSLGQTETVVVYADNESNESIMLTVTTANYTPANASEYLNFSCANMRILANETVQVTQSLYVSPNAGGISDFSFDIIFTAKQYVLGDINGDGVVNMYDAILLSAAYGSHGPNYDYLGEPASSNWNPNADRNNDGVVDIYDVIIMSAQLSMSVQ